MIRLPESLNLYVEGHLSLADAERQARSAAELLARLAVQPGAILGDEVGMGKTFVALAVASSFVVADPTRPVIVMVPPRVVEKWVRDANTFRERCLVGEDRARLRVASVETGVGLLKLLDDPPPRRASLIVLAHGALHRKMADKWVKLAMLQAAVRGRHGSEDLRRRLARFAPMILSGAREPDRDFELYLRLLNTPPALWLPVLAAADQAPKDGDNPVPVAFMEALERIDLTPLYRTLQECLPERKSEKLVERVARARKALDDGDTSLPTGRRGGVADVWALAMQHSHLSFPLLVLDEAHRARNANTQLAALLQRGRDEELDAASGQLANRFDRMLFLTATPFQLGHNELVNVLRRFEAIRWDGCAAPAMTLADFRADTKTLQVALDAMQVATDGLERAWKRLRAADVADAQHTLGHAWWESVTDAACGVDERVRSVQVAFASARAAVRRAEACLRPWLLRNTRSPWLATADGPVPRRVRVEGEAVVAEALAPDDAAGPASSGGLKVRDDCMLPFLLVARMATLPNVAKVFAEGLPSSYEAALDTRRDKDDTPAAIANAALDLDQRRGRWYAQRLREAAATEEAKGLSHHPKLKATVDLAMSLWRRGEKVLIFAHYQQTGAALQRYLSEAMLASTERQGALTFGCAAHEVAAQVESRQNQIDDRPADEAIAGVLEEMLERLPALRGDGLPDRLKSVVKRFVRTATFLVRFGGRREERAVADWVRNMFDRPDSSGMSLRMLVAQFLDFLARLEARSQHAYLDALDSIRTGTHAGVAEASFDADEVADAERRKVRLMPNVGRVYGETHEETKQRRLLAFNTPFYPEILIASSVAAEGVDLHLNCSHVIHHDLDWNPSSLEQRTGRIDRLGAKCERAGRSIRVYLPYVEGCQDEKLFRVVMERERWFGVVMGADASMARLLSANPWELERLADAVPVPERLAADLAMRGLAVEPSAAAGAERTQRAVTVVA